MHLSVGGSKTVHRKSVSGTEEAKCTITNSSRQEAILECDHAGTELTKRHKQNKTLACRIREETYNLKLISSRYSRSFPIAFRMYINNLRFHVLREKERP